MIYGASVAVPLWVGGVFVLVVGVVSGVNWWMNRDRFKG